MAAMPGGIARATTMAVALLLAACYPELDWREVASTSGHYKVLLPARPDLEERQVVIGGLTLVMSMSSVRKDGMAFGAAYAEIPGGYDQRAELLVAARDALVRNIGGRITADRELRIDGATGREFFADGSVGGQPTRLAARVITAGPRFYQVVVVGRSERVAEADVGLFLGSFRLLAN